MSPTPPLSPMHPRLEFMPSDEMEALRGRKLASLVRRAAAAGGFNAERFRAAGLDPESVHGMRDLERIPFTTKPEVIADQQAHPPLGSRVLVPEREIRRIAVSGGSSGKGREMVAHTQQDLMVQAGLQGIAFRWAGLGEDDVIVFHVPLANSTASLAFPGGVEAVGRIKYLLGHEGFAQRLDLMRTFGATGMWGSPSSINGFTQECVTAGIDPRRDFPGFRSLIIAAESYSTAWAARISDVWAGARVVEGYGATQTHGCYCYASCERGAIPDGERGTMHGFDWSFILEVLDPQTDTPVQPGEAGELVVTTLDKRASPVIRYRTGDRVVVVEGPCPCGRQTTLIEAGTVGRFDDMVKVKGVNIWPSEVDDVVLAIPGLRDYHASVVIGERGRDELELRYTVSTPGQEEAVAAELMSRFKRQFGITPRAIPAPFEDLPIRYGDGGKARRWVDRRREAMDR